jgi:hypothetical protein
MSAIPLSVSGGMRENERVCELDSCAPSDTESCVVERNCEKPPGESFTRNCNVSLVVRNHHVHLPAHSQNCDLAVLAAGLGCTIHVTQLALPSMAVDALSKGVAALRAMRAPPAEQRSLRHSYRRSPQRRQTTSATADLTSQKAKQRAEQPGKMQQEQYSTRRATATRRKSSSRQESSILQLQSTDRNERKAACALTEPSRSLPHDLETIDQLLDGLVLLDCHLRTAMSCAPAFTLHTVLGGTNASDDEACTVLADLGRTFITACALPGAVVPRLQPSHTTAAATYLSQPVLSGAGDTGKDLFNMNLSCGGHARPRDTRGLPRLHSVVGLSSCGSAGTHVQRSANAARGQHWPSNDCDGALQQQQQKQKQQQKQQQQQTQTAMRQPQCVPAWLHQQPPSLEDLHVQLQACQKLHGSLCSTSSRNTAPRSDKGKSSETSSARGLLCPATQASLLLGGQQH